MTASEMLRAFCLVNERTGFVAQVPGPRALALQSEATAVHPPRHGFVDPCAGLAVVLFEPAIGLASDACRDGYRLCAGQHRHISCSEEGGARFVMDCGLEGALGRHCGWPSLAHWRDTHRGLGAAYLGAGGREERDYGQVTS